MIGNMSYLPNVEGALFFCRDVLPRVQAERPAELVIAGSSPAPAVRALAGLPGVTVAASPPDIAPFYRGARLAVVPIRAGGGTRIKLLEAFVNRVPVASTRLGAEGLAVEHERHLLLADNAAPFAKACGRLYEDDALRNRLVEAAFELCRRDHSIEALRARFARAG
jgi:glycosyltransferase involved in cell wall biosynthesis